MTDVGERPVLVEKRHDHVAIVKLNRPGARNAINESIALGLDAAWREIDADPDIRVAILAAEGTKVFCAGADLKEVEAGRLESLYTAESGFAGFVNGRRTKPWIAAIEGLALAGGCELALACDMIVASQDAAFGLPEVSVGLIAAAGGLYRLSRVLPRAIAIELILTGGRISAGDAARWGLVNRLTAPGQAVAESLVLARAITANAPVAVRESLAVARASHALDEEAAQALSDEAQARIRKTEDFAEGPRAFAERRSPIWTGR